MIMNKEFKEKIESLVQGYCKSEYELQRLVEAIYKVFHKDIFIRVSK